MGAAFARADASCRAARAAQESEVSKQFDTLYKGALVDVALDLHEKLRGVGPAAQIMAALMRACKEYVDARFAEAQAGMLAALHVKAEASQLLDATFKRIFQARRAGAHARSAARAVERALMRPPISCLRRSRTHRWWAWMRRT